MNTVTPRPSAKPFRARSSLPFFVGLTVLSGVYVLLIVGMLLAEVLFLYPPTRLVMLVPKGNPQKVHKLEDLRRNDLRLGLGDPEQGDFGKKTEKLLQLAWLNDEVRHQERSTPVVLTEHARGLVSRIVLGTLDVAIVTEESLNSSYIAMVTRRDNPNNIRTVTDLTNKKAKLGLVDLKKTFGQQTRTLLEATGTWSKIVDQPIHYAESQQALVDALKKGDADVILVAPRSVDLDKKAVEVIGPVEKVTIDITGFPKHLSAAWYPLWWLNIKLWALLEPLTHEEIRYALWLSLISCSITTILSLWVAVPFGYLMSRYNFFGKTIIDAILDIPIVLPPLVIGLALLILFQTQIGRAFEDNVISITYAIPSVILAQFAVACAFAVRTMRVSFDQISVRQEQVALTLGCSRGQAFWKVVLPEARRGMITAATLAWARSLGEFGPILIFSGATRMRTEVLPTSVFLELSVGNIETAVAVSLLMVIAAAIVLVIVRVFGMEKTPVHVK